MIVKELRGSLTLVDDLDDDVPVLLDSTSGMRFHIAEHLVDRVRVALEPGASMDEETERFFEARHLIDSPRVGSIEAWAAAHTEPAPSETTGQKLRLVIPEGTRFTCHGCGMCCRSYGIVPISDEERATITARAAELAPHVKTPESGWFLEKRGKEEENQPFHGWSIAHQPDGSCIFLDDDGLCLVHKRLGIEAKPQTCRQFPLKFTARPDGLVVTIRPECETLARSRDDGMALTDQLEWVQAMVPGARAQVVAGIVRVSGRAFIPFALAKHVDSMAHRLMSTAPSVEHGMLAVRDLVCGVGRIFDGEPPVPDELDQALAWVKLSIRERREKLGPIWPPLGVAQLGRLLVVLLGGLPHLFAQRVRFPPGSFQKRDDQFIASVLRTLYASLGARSGWPPHGDVGPAAAEEGARALAVDTAATDPAIVDFVRECFAQVIASSRAYDMHAGLVAGYGQIAIVHILARWGVRLLAARRGDARATREDWNHSIASIERCVRPLTVEGSSPAIIGIYDDLIWTKDMPG